MISIFIYTISSVLLVSIVSLIGIFTLGIKEEWLNKILFFLISFSTGALLADAIFHLLPEISETYGMTFMISSYIILGMVFSFVIEKTIHWHHYHNPGHMDEHVHSFAYMNLFGDSVHNFIDGLIIGASYLVSIPVGIATTIAVIIHEIPQEIGDFGVLIHGGLSKRRALMLNFMTALMAIVGALIALALATYTDMVIKFLIPFAAGNFLYIAGADLIPELHKETRIRHSFLQVFGLILGIVIIASFVFLE